MATYKQQQEKKKFFVILDGDVVLGVFGNLKKACDFMGDKDFPSYSTLSKKKFVRFDHKRYSLQKVKNL